MKILVAGGSGQLGLALQRQKGDHYLAAFDHSDLDITNAGQVAEVFADEMPTALINCAAWTNVDACEGDPEKAMLVNGTAVGVLASEATKAGARFVQISTDYVFDGTKEGPYFEDDIPNPLSVYGKSKLLGEQLAGPDALIVRTSWVMGPDGHNMLKTILRLLESPDDLHFVDDQRGCPTFTDDLAEAIIELLEQKAQGIFHVTNAGTVSWYQFACAVALSCGIDSGRIHPTRTSDLKPSRPAPRPSNSELKSQSLLNLKIDSLRHFDLALKSFVTNLPQQPR
jgi:dTDP-4-dehydrorhamnose reductase